MASDKPSSVNQLEQNLESCYYAPMKLELELQKCGSGVNKKQK
jgi:hypothetical protein